MKKFGDFIVKNKVIILIVCLLALIPSIIGMINTKINYNILVYLPDDIETMKGEKILSDDFNLGSFSISILDNMSADDALKFESKVKEIDGVNKVMSLYDVVGTQIPLEMLPDDVQEKVVKGDSTLLLITFKDSISDEKTMNAVSEIRKLADDTVKVGGMTSMVLDTKNLSDSEVTTYVIIAVVCCILVLMIALDSYTVPFLLLLNIGIAVLYNMGTNIFLGNISYITKAISSILQLGVTTDFSIFLYHQYEHEKKDAKNKEEAMSKAIGKTLNSIIGSSTTTIAGFLALCTMQLTLGKDIGIVMAKGVLFGVITVVTLFPALILIFDKIISKTEHKSLIPEFKHVNNFVIKNYKWILVVFVLLLIPAWWGQKNTKVYYNLDRTLPDTLASSIANKELEDKYKIVSPMIILASKDLSNDQINEMCNKLKAMDHIDLVLSYSQLSDLNIPDEMMDDDIKSIFESDKYKLILINSTYEKATDELNKQITKINKLVKSYDKDSILAGEGALTNDLVKISATDFNNVNYTSIAVILIIIILVLKSYSLPIILIAAIEFAIFVNMAIPYYTGVTIPFVSSIVIGTIQLGATIDYAILMTNKYLEKRVQGVDKFEAIKHSLNSSVNSIFTSGMCFFAATFGVGVYSDLEMVGSLCTLIARGAIISMLVVILILPSLLLTFDKIICKTTKGFKKGDIKMKKELKTAAILLVTSLIIPFNVNALSKDETVYVKMDNTGLVNKTIVAEHLKNTDNKEIKDLSYLTNIVNTNGKEKYTTDGNTLTWTSTGNDIYYKGTSSKELPVSLKISYYLDNKEYPDLNEIKNAKGHVKIDVKFTNNEKHGSIYTPFTVILVASISNDNNKNIIINNGEVLDNGKKSVATGIAMPGLSESLGVSELTKLNNIIIEYDTTKFSTSSMYAVITPKFLNTNQLTSELNTLYNDMDLLNNSSTSLVSGAKELNNGLTALNNSYNEFNTNLNKLSSGAAALSTTYSKDLNNNIAAINEGMKKLNMATSSLDNLSANINKLAGATNQLAGATSNLDKQLETLINGLNAKSEAMGEIIKSLTPEEQKTLAKQITIVMAPADLSSLSTLKANIDAINNNVQALNTNVNALANGTKDLSSSVNTLSTNMNLIADGSNKFNANLGYFTSSMNTLNEASNNKVIPGIQKLNNGSTELYNGLVKFDSEGIKVLYNTINTTLKNKVNTLNSLNNLSENYNSFAGTANGTKSETKFIIQINK